MSVEGDFDESEDDDEKDYELRVGESAFEDLWDCAISCGHHHCNLLFKVAMVTGSLSCYLKWDVS